MIDRAMFGLDRLLTQQAVIERDHAQSDDFGSVGTPDWQPLDPLPAFMWWGSGRTITRAGDVLARPEETVDLNRGGMLLPEGADVTARDRIGQVLDSEGDVLERGPFEILAALPFEGVTELTFRRFT